MGETKDVGGRRPGGPPRGPFGSPAPPLSPGSGPLAGSRRGGLSPHLAPCALGVHSRRPAGELSLPRALVFAGVCVEEPGVGEHLLPPPRPPPWLPCAHGSGQAWPVASGCLRTPVCSLPRGSERAPAQLPFGKGPSLLPPAARAARPGLDPSLGSPRSLGPCVFGPGDFGRSPRLQRVCAAHRGPGLCAGSCPTQDSGRGWGRGAALGGGLRPPASLRLPSRAARGAEGSGPPCAKPVVSQRAESRLLSACPCRLCVS